VRLTGGAGFDIALDMKQLLCLLLLSLLACIVGAGCRSTPKIPGMDREADRLSQPPPGKALVNIHRPSGLAKRGSAIFDGNGKLLVDLPGASLFQYVCDPGEQVFITWADRVSVVIADVAPDKIYDIMADTAAGWTRPGIFFTPLTKDNPRRAKLAEFAKREKKTLALNPASPRVAQYEANNQAHLAEIRRDFLGGAKSNHVDHLQKDDCR
jgi:hypothetical protein